MVEALFVDATVFRAPRWSRDLKCKDQRCRLNASITFLAHHRQRPSSNLALGDLLSIQPRTEKGEASEDNMNTQLWLPVLSRIRPAFTQQARRSFSTCHICASGSNKVRPCILCRRSNLSGPRAAHILQTTDDFLLFSIRSSGPKSNTKKLPTMQQKALHTVRSRARSSPASNNTLPTHLPLRPPPLLKPLTRFTTYASECS